MSCRTLLPRLRETRQLAKQQRFAYCLLLLLLWGGRSLPAAAVTRGVVLRPEDVENLQRQSQAHGSKRPRQLVVVLANSFAIPDYHIHRQATGHWHLVVRDDAGIVVDLRCFRVVTHAAVAAAGNVTRARRPGRESPSALTLDSACCLHSSQHGCCARVRDNRRQSADARGSPNDSFYRTQAAEDTRH